MANPGGTPENLKPWRPGQTGNPNGYSKRRRLRDILLKLLEERSRDEKFMKVALKAALAGDFNFWKFLFEVAEGKVPQKIEVDYEQMYKILKVPPGRRKREAGPDAAAAAIEAARATGRGGDNGAALDGPPEG